MKRETQEDIPSIRGNLLQQLKSIDLPQLIAKIEKAHVTHVNSVPLEILQHSKCEGLLASKRTVHT